MALEVKKTWRERRGKLGVSHDLETRTVCLTGESWKASEKETIYFDVKEIDTVIEMLNKLKKVRTENAIDDRNSRF